MPVKVVVLMTLGRTQLMKKVTRRIFFFVQYSVLAILHTKFKSTSIKTGLVDGLKKMFRISTGLGCNLESSLNFLELQCKM